MRIDRRVVGAFALGLLGPLALLWGASAGDLEPPGPPASTMKDLDRIAPVWSETLPADDGDGTCNSSRFRCVFDGDGVLDMDTGLVWERSPSITTRTWAVAVDECFKRDHGYRRGWRAPTVEELGSLVDLLAPSAPHLPAGHPFENVQTGSQTEYWTSTTAATNTLNGYAVGFTSGTLGGLGKGASRHVWCVRGGHGHDAY